MYLALTCLATCRSCSVVAERTYSFTKNAWQDHCFYEQVIIMDKSDVLHEEFTNRDGHLPRLLQMWTKRCIAVMWLSTMVISTIQPRMWSPSILSG